MYFLKNPEYVHSKPVVATNLVEEVIIKSSVGKMGEHFFGREDEQGGIKISDAIETGETINGFSFAFVNHKGFENVFPRSEADTSKKPVYQIDIHSGRLIRFHPCITSAAKKLREGSVIPIRGNVQTTLCRIKDTVKGRQNTAYGFYRALALPSTNIPVEEDWDLEGM